MGPSVDRADRVGGAESCGGYSPYPGASRVATRGCKCGSAPSSTLRAASSCGRCAGIRWMTCEARRYSRYLGTGPMRFLSATIWLVAAVVTRAC